jgi:hypothetical protein
MSEKKISEREKDERHAKSRLSVVRTDYSMYVTAIAVMEKNTDENTRLKIPTGKGIPFGGYIYDSSNQCYFVRGVDTHNIGSVAVSFHVEMPEFPYWKMPIPVSEKILRKHMTAKQRDNLEHFENSYPKCKIYFLQMINHNS